MVRSHIVRHHSPAMAKFNCGMPDALATFLVAVAESLGVLEGKDQTFLRGLQTGWQGGGLLTGLLVVGHHL